MSDSTNDIVLTEEQRKFVDANWDKMKRADLIRQTFNNPKLDGRSFEGRAVMAYLGEREPTPSVYQKVAQVDLTDEQKEYITNNAKFATPTEMARTLFNNRMLTPLHQETRSILAFVKTLPEEVSGRSFADDVSENYRPPSTVKQIVERVNEYVQTTFEHDKINNQQKKMFESIISFLKSPRYLQMINSYTSKLNRNIFEGEYIRTIYDKPDLTPDELNLCINLCWNYVKMITVNKHLDMLNEKYEMVVTDPDSKISQALADMITAKNKELNDCDTRQQKLIDDLNGKRSDRQKNRVNSGLTMATLVEFWKDEEERAKMLKKANIRKRELVEEVDRIESMEEFKARMMGFTKSELING